MFSEFSRRWARYGPITIILACLLLAAAPAGATIRRHPVQVRIEGTPRAAEAGKPFEAVLEIKAVADVTLEEFFIDTGRSWRLSNGIVPGRLHLTKGEVRRIPFTVITDDPGEPLHIEYQVGNETVRKAVDLSPAGAAAAKPARLVAIDDPQVLNTLNSSIDPEARRPEAPPVDDRPADHAIEPGAETKDRSVSPAAHNVRVVGFFNYRRMNDNIAVGVDGAIARIYDEDSSWDELLATQVLGPDGRLDVTFNWDPCFGCDGTPDIYVEFELENAEIDVHDDTIWESDYRFETGVWQDYGGTYLDIGAQIPGNASLIPACHIMTIATRAWRFTFNNGRDTPKVGYQWPDNDGCGACYDDGLEEVYINSDRQWNENTIIHEFGHHWVNTWAVITEPDYCNGMCDTPTCGHCIWCQETDHDAFNEGFPNYYQDVVMRTFTTPPVTAARTYETLTTCNGSTYGDPLRTEGFFAALLRDMDDSYNENELTQSKGKDQMTLGFDEIFWLVDFHQPTTPQIFLNRFREEYPQLKELFWATAINNGYQTDFAPPGKVTNLRSDHTLNQNSDTRPNIKWMWDRAPDDASGVAGYSIWIQQGILPGMPDATAEVYNVTEFTSGPHPPGWYYISIRALDANGTWSDTYETMGPYGIRAADPANLTVPIHSNWDYCGAMPRNIADASEFDVEAPNYLDGQGSLTYLSAIYKNSGEQATSVDQRWIDFYVDMYQVAFNHHLGFLGPGAYNYVLNQPVTINGGRHVLGVRLDDSDFMSEPNEVDNQWARQWAWNPPWLNLGATAFYPSPPTMYQGTEWIVDGSAFYQNCRGFRAQDEVANLPNTMWTAVALHATDDADYDLNVFGTYTTPTGSFTSPFTGSYRGANATDVYLFNSWQFWGTPIPLDYGITNYSGGVPGQNGFHIQKVTSQSMSFPGGLLDTMSPNEMLKLYQYYSPGGNVMARVTSDPSQGQVYLTLVPQAFSNGPLLGAGTTVVTDPVTGEALINEPQSGYQCLAVWRDPTMGTGSLGLLVTIQATPADLAVVTPPGWAAPLVPRPSPDGTPGAVPAPALLLGDVPQTYLNYAVTNAGPATVPPNPVVTFYGDGAPIYTETPPWPGPGATMYRNLATSVQIRGGRHVLGLRLDANDEAGEITNANNTTAGQWVWGPLLPPFDLAWARPQPADRFGGWEIMPAGAPLLFNVDGLRTASSSPDGSGNGWKVAAFAMPDAGMDVDLKLYEAAPDAVTGFDVELTSSSWGIDQPDFVIADFRATSPRQFDVGYLAPTVQPGSSMTQFRRSTYLGQGPAGPSVVEPASLSASVRPLEATAGGSHGPYTIGAGDLFDLFEVDLPIGTYDIRVVPGSGSVDWGIAVYGPGPAFLSRSDALPGGTAWQAAPGAPEILHVTIEEAGLHGVVVWKNRRADVSTAGTFTLQFTRLSSGAPGDPVPGGPYHLIAGIRPNPFAGSTGVDVRLPEPADVSLQVFDPSGRRLHLENFGRRESGAHVFHWDGRDDRGEPVPAGIYFVRVTAGHLSDGKKIVRVR
jgi:hypothetical protein